MVEQDVFSRFLWTEALTSKRHENVAKAFEDIMTSADAEPKICTSDLGPEFQGPFEQPLKAKGVEAFKNENRTLMPLLH